MNAVELWGGIIWMLVLGPAVGNYATSVVYRLPLRQTPFEKKPYCDHCGMMLEPRDLFPILSYAMTQGKCRGCASHIPFSYTLIEILCAIIFITNYLLMGISESFILITAMAVFWMILVALDYHQKQIYSLISTYVLALSALYRGITDASIYPMFASVMVLLVWAALLWRFSGWVKKQQSPVPTDRFWLAALIGIVTPIAWLLPVLGIYAWIFLRGAYGNRLWLRSAASFAVAYALLLSPFLAN